MIENPNTEEGFGGVRATLDFFQSLTASTDLTSLLVVDENVKDSDDLRGDWTNSLTVAMSDNLALKASLQILFDNAPALAAIPLGTEQVLAPLQKSDRSLTLALVVNF